MQHIEKDYGDNHDTLEKSIIKGLREFYLSEILCDATVVTADKRFPCHRIVLSSVSPYFQVLFTCPMKESESGDVSLLDIPSSVMQVILRFIYSSEAALTMDNVEELFTVSSRLQIKPIQDLCSRFLIKNIDSENCLWIYRLAKSHNDRSLLDVAMHYISQRLTSLSEKEDFYYLDLSEVTGILSSNELMVSSELTIYNLACRWWEFNSYKGNPLSEELLKVVRFPLMTPHELSEVNIDIPTENATPTSTEFHLRQGMFEDRILCMDMLERYETDPEQNDYHVNSYDPITSSWEKLPFISPLGTPGLVAISHILYVSGGYNEDNSVSSLLHVYDSIKNEWKEFPSMAKPRYGHGFLHYRDALYAVGGHDGNKTLSSAECFNLVKNCWTTASSLPQPLRNFASAQFKGRLFLIGGFSDSVKKFTRYQGFLMYDISSDTWSQFPLSMVLSASGAIVSDDKLYVIANYDSRHGDCHAYLADDEHQAYPLYHEEPNTIVRSFCLDHLGRIYHSTIPPFPESIDPSEVIVWKNRIYIVGRNRMDSDCQGQMFYWGTGDPRWTTCYNEMPFLFDDYFGSVTMQVPLKHFHSLIPGRKSSYNFRTEDQNNETDEEPWWEDVYSI